MRKPQTKPGRPVVTPGSLLFCCSDQPWEKYRTSADDFPYDDSAAKVAMVVAVNTQMTAMLSDNTFSAFVLTEEGAFWTVALYAEVVCAYP